MNTVNITEMHKLSGALPKKRPSRFVRLFEPDCSEIETVTGRYGGGTFVSERVAAMYEQWLVGGVDSTFRSRMEKESAALATIEQILGVRLVKQFKVLNYRIDGYDEENKIAYEIDEIHHKTTVNYAKDMRRQKKIEQELGCSFVRVKV